MNDIDLKRSFVSLTRSLHYQPKSIFPSEMFLFYKEAMKINVDHIIESGVGFGGSTSYLDKLFPNVLITSIDKGKVKLTRDKHRRIRFVQGDGYKEVLNAIGNSKGLRIAVLIDGPKGVIAVSLAQKLVGIVRVKLVAIHDPYDKDIEYVDIIKQMNSHDDTFRKFAGDLDHKADLDKYPNGPGLRLYLC